MKLETNSFVNFTYTRSKLIQNIQILGGTGIPPTNARTGDGISLKSEVKDPVLQDSDSEEPTFHVRGLPPLTDAFSVEARYDAMRKILLQTQNYHSRYDNSG